MERRAVMMGMGMGAIAAAGALGAKPADAAEGAAKAAAKDAGKIAVITGFSSGIGYGTALELAARGIHVIGSYRNNRPGAMKLVEEAGKLGVKVVPFHLDLNSMDSIAKFQADVAATLRRDFDRETFDYLSNNAGMSTMAPFGETKEEAFDEMNRVLFKGHYFMAQGLLPLIADGGAIVNVTSSSTLPTSISVGFSAYAAMKGAMTTLTRYMAKELAPRGIRVNSVAPGPTRTRLGNDGFSRFPEVIPPLVAETALKRLGEPVDLGRVISALLSDQLGWVTGENIEVSGGYRM